MIINITQEHINRGQKCRAHRCPMALAVQDQLNLSPGLVAVTQYTLYIDCKALTLPPAASNFVKSFDAGREVSPFTFEVKNDPNQGESAAHPFSDQT